MKNPKTPKPQNPTVVNKVFDLNLNESVDKIGDLPLVQTEILGGVKDTKRRFESINFKLRNNF